VNEGLEADCLPEVVLYNPNDPPEVIYPECKIQGTLVQRPTPRPDLSAIVVADEPEGHTPDVSDEEDEEVEENEDEVQAQEERMRREREERWRAEENKAKRRKIKKDFFFISCLLSIALR
jgi:hypothetical protein